MTDNRVKQYKRNETNESIRVFGAVSPAEGERVIRRQRCWCILDVSESTKTRWFQ